MSELIIYQSDDGKARVQFRAMDGNVWLNQQEIAELFNTSKQNASLHIKNILAEGELRSEATVKESLIVQTEGRRKVQRQVLLYNLPLILAVGYRVRTARGTQFRLPTLPNTWSKVSSWTTNASRTREAGITSTNCWRASARFARLKSAAHGKNIN